MLTDFVRPGSNSFFYNLGRAWGVDTSLSDIEADTQFIVTRENYTFYRAGVADHGI
jgi:hypothetical protein